MPIKRSRYLITAGVLEALLCPVLIAQTVCIGSTDQPCGLATVLTGNPPTALTYTTRSHLR
jgi:hypothetical protein